MVCELYDPAFPPRQRSLHVVVEHGEIVQRLVHDGRRDLPPLFHHVRVDVIRLITQQHAHEELIVRRAGDESSLRAEGRQLFGAGGERFLCRAE